MPVAPRTPRAAADPAALAARFLALFAGGAKAHGVFRPARAARRAPGGKLAGGQSTADGPPTAALWAAHLAGETGLGVYPLRLDGTVRFAALDVDAYPVDHARLAARVREARLPLLVAASKSGGAHLYLFGKTDLPAGLVRSRLAAWAATLGLYELVSTAAKVELFPHKDALAGPADFGKYLNMPYLGGGANVGFDDRGKPLDAVGFLARAAALAVDAAALEALSPLGDAAAALADGPPCLQALLAGEPVAEYRDNTLVNLGVYLRQRFPDAWEAKVEEYHRRFIAEALPAADVVKVIRSVGKRSYNYMCHQEPIASRCNSSVCVGRRYGVRAKAAADGAETGFDLNLGSLVKFLSEPPTWELEVNGKVLRLTSEELLSPVKFRRAALDACDVLVPTLKQETWDRMIKDKLATLEIADAPADAGEPGAVRWHLERWVTQTRARAREELKDGRAWWDEAAGRVYFRSTGFTEYLQRHRIFVGQRELSVYFRTWGFEHGKFNLHGACVTWWSLPVFETQTEPDEVPRPGAAATGAF